MQARPQCSKSNDKKNDAREIAMRSDLNRQRTVSMYGWCCLEPAGGSTPEGVVNLVDDVGGHDCAVVEAATVKTLQSFLTTRDRVKLDVNVAFSVRVDGDVNDLAILLVTLGPDFGLKVLDPAAAILALLPSSESAYSPSYLEWTTYSSGLKAFSILMHFEAIGLSTTGARGLLTTGAAPCLAGSAGSRRASASISLERS